MNSMLQAAVLIVILQHISGSTAAFGFVQMSIGAAKSLFIDAKSNHNNRGPITKSTNGKAPNVDFLGMAQTALGVGLMAAGAALRYRDMDAGLEVIEEASNNHRAIFAAEAAIFIKRGATPHVVRAAARLLGATNQQAKAAESLAAKLRERRRAAMNIFSRMPPNNNDIRPNIRVGAGAPKTEQKDIRFLFSVNGLGSIGNENADYLNGNSKTRGLKTDEGFRIQKKIEEYEAKIDSITEGKLENQEQKADLFTALLAATMVTTYGIEELIAIGVLDEQDVEI